MKPLPIDTIKKGLNMYAVRDSRISGKQKDTTSLL